MSDVAADTRFLDGGGRAAAIIRARDWTTHPLGSPAGWPDGLKAALSLVVNSPESMILCWGPDLTFFFNDTYFPLLGPRLDWAMGARFDEVWADALDQAMPIVEEAFAGHSRRFTDLPWTLDTDRGPAETWWSFSYSRILDADGGIAGLFILTTETTKRVQADAALVTTQAGLAAALDELRALNGSLETQVAQRTAERDRMWQHSPDLMLFLDAGTRRIQQANPAWATLLGREPAELVGVHPRELVHPDDQASSRETAARARHGIVVNFDNRFRHRDGTYRWFSWVTTVVGDQIFAIGRHVTAEKAAADALRQAEDQLRQAQKVEAVGQLTGGVAHDFNNLLTVIRGSVDLLRRPGLSEERRARYIDAIADTADRATRLTSQLLAFARRQALNPEQFDVGADLRQVADMLGTLAGSRIRVTLDLPEIPHYVNADRSQFDTAIVNMAINARDAMGGEGRLLIRVAPADGTPAIRAHPPQPGDYVTIALTDSGGGIPPDVLDRIFEPFFTTKGVGEGTGLGLSQVFGFAKQSGGEVAVDSRTDDGATFTLYLPRVPAPAAPVADGDGRAAPAFGRGACVLVVEDNPEVGAFATQALDELGYRSLLAPDAAAALAMLDNDGNDGGGPGGAGIQLVFSDVVMPGMGGVELAQAIRARRPELPVVLTSGYSTVLAQEGRHGFELLQKPYSIDALARVLAKVAAAGR